MQYEVEIKCLIDDPDRSKDLPDEIRKLGYGIEQIAEHRQLNDYFVDGDITQLAEQVKSLIGAEQYAVLQDVVVINRTFSVRTRQSNDTVLFIVKATTGESANHAAQRTEFEVPVACSLGELKDAILASGYTMQARWMGRRTIYRVSNGITLDRMFAPGYGHQAEFELVVHSKDETADAERRVREFAAQLGLRPIDKELIEKMFEYYNAHWQEYYDTEKVFRLDSQGVAQDTTV